MGKNKKKRRESQRTEVLREEVMFACLLAFLLGGFGEDKKNSVTVLLVEHGLGVQ